MIILKNVTFVFVFKTNPPSATVNVLFTLNRSDIKQETRNYFILAWPLMINIIIFFKKNQSPVKKCLGNS